MRRILVLGLVVLTALGLSACSDDDDDDSAAPALVRVAHFSPDAPNVDVRVDGSLALDDVPYTAVSDYLEVPAGSRRFTVTPAGQATPVVIDATVPLTSGAAYTVAASGLLAGIAPVLIDNDDRATASSGAKVRFVHLSPDAPSVDIAVTGGAVVFPDVAFREFTDYVTLPAGTYNLEVRVAGTANVALAVPGVTVANGQNYTVFARGLAGGGTLAAQVAIDAD